jgi:hypothetical protein
MVLLLLLLLVLLPLKCGGASRYSYHRQAGGTGSAGGGDADAVAERIASAEELWNGARKLWETHGAGVAWPVAFEATKLDPLDPALIFNAAVLREQYNAAAARAGRRQNKGEKGQARNAETNGGDGEPGPSQIELLAQAHALAWKYDLRLKAAWNLASLVEMQHAHNQTTRSRANALEAWRDVLDVPMVSKRMKGEALAKIQKLRERGAAEGTLSVDDDPSTGTFTSTTATTTTTTGEANILLSTLNTLLSVMHSDHLEKDRMHAESSRRGPSLETMDMAKLDAIGVLLSCIAGRSRSRSATATTVSTAAAISYCCDAPGLDPGRDSANTAADAVTNADADADADIIVEIDDSSSSRMASLTGFINAVHASIVRPRERRKDKTRRSRRQMQRSCVAPKGASSSSCSTAPPPPTLHPSPNVLVVGAGPSGMTTALTAFRDGAASVSVFEKRASAPSRQHWFDADPKTMQVLSEWGLGRFVQVPMQLEPTMPGYATFQCHMLERFLALVAYASSSSSPSMGTDGIVVRRGIAFERFVDDGETWKERGRKEKDKKQREDVEGVGSSPVALFRRVNTRAGGTVDSAVPLLEAVPFDVLFACDGANSAVREAAGVSAELQGTFLPFREEIGKRRDEKSIRRKQERGERRLAQLKGTFKPQSKSRDGELLAEEEEEVEQGEQGEQEQDGLSHTTLILAFELERRNNSYACPAYHEHLGAFAPAVADVSGGITAVFKRMHSPFCEFQVLLSHELLASLRVLGASRVPMNRIFVDQDFFPWDAVLAAADSLFARPFGSVDNLRRALRPYAYHRFSLIGRSSEHDGVTAGAAAAGAGAAATAAMVPAPRHAVLFRMGIRRANRSALVHDNCGIVVIRGDAVLSAHYRLGIGINQAFASLENEVSGIVLQWQRLFELSAAENRRSTTRVAVLEELAERHRLRADPRVTWMSDVQLFTMFFEAYCDLVVDNSDLNDLVVLRKVRAGVGGADVAAHVGDEPLSDVDIQQLPCMLRWLSFSRNRVP